MNGTGRRLYPAEPKIWKSDTQEVVLIAVMLYEVRPGDDSSAESFEDPLTPEKVMNQRASVPAMDTLSFSE